MAGKKGRSGRKPGQRPIKTILGKYTVDKLKQPILMAFHKVLYATENMTDKERAEIAVKIAQYVIPRQQQVEINATVRTVDDELRAIGI